MSVEANKALVRRFFSEVLDQHNLAAADELMAVDYVDHALADASGGRESWKQFISVFFSAFPDLSFTVDDMLAEGDKVVTRHTARGTHRGDLMGIAPTGRAVTITGIDIERVADGRVVEGWLNIDTLGMLQQIGAVPHPSQDA